MDQTEQEMEMGQRCFAMAYLVVPRFLFEDPEFVIDKLSEGADGARFFWFVTHDMRNQVPDRETMEQFSATRGDLDDEHEYFIIQYPEPAPLNVDLEQAIRTKKPLGKFVIAPYFSAVVRTKASGAVRYFTLEQEFGGGTNFRTVTPEMSANLGEGCAPELNAFVQFLRERLAAEASPPVLAMQSRNLYGEQQPQPNEPPMKKWWQFWR